MKTTIKRDWLDKFQSADITEIQSDEYCEIIFCVRMRLESLEKDLEEYKQKEFLKEFIPKREEEYKQLENLIKKMEG